MPSLANRLALSELANALDTLEKPHDKLPEVKDNNGTVITDAKDKRLALVRQLIRNAGDIINLAEQANTAAEMTTQIAIQQKFRPQIEAALKAEGTNVNFMPDPDCNCPDCRAARGNQGSDNPAEEFGFGRIVKQNREIH